MDQELCLVWLYCVIDGTLRSMIGTGRLRRRGPAPDLADAEVLTLQIWGEMRGLASDAAIWRDAAATLQGWFHASAPSGTSCGGAATAQACRSGC